MLETLQQSLQATLQDLVETVVGMTPTVLMGVVLIVVALIVAKLVEKILRTILVRVRLDSMMERAGIDQALQKVGLRQSLNQFLPRVAYFLLLFLFARTAADALGLVAISAAIGSFLAYMPNIIAAVLIMLLGSAAAQFAGRAVAEAAENSGIDFAKPLGTMVSALILFVLGIMAVGQLQLDTEIIRLVTATGLAGLGLAFGLSFGLGTREITRNMVAGFYARKILEVGEPVEISGERGVLRAITPTQTLLDQEGRLVALSNKVFLDQVIKQ